MKLKAHFGPSILLVTFCSIKAQREPNLTLTLCALLYQETGATYSPCHCLLRYAIKYSRTAPAQNTSGTHPFLSHLSFSASSLFCTQAHAHCLLPVWKVFTCWVFLLSWFRSQKAILTKPHLTPSKQHLPPKSITNNNVFIKLFCETFCLMQSSSPHCFNYNKSPSLWCILQYSKSTA